MVKKTVGYVELEWTCPRCQTRNPGPNKFCNGCGAPQPEDVAFEQPLQEKLITDAATLAQAKAGPDVHCAYCSGRNLASAKFCGSCGADLAGAKAREKGRVVGAHRSAPMPDVACPACGTMNPADARQCRQCSAPLPGAGAAAAPAAPRPPARPMGRGLVIGGAAVFGICLLAAVILMLLSGRTQERVAQVQSVEWERSVEVLGLAPVGGQDWADQIPSQAEVGACRDELRQTVDQAQPGAIEVCGTPYTLDSGSGFGEVVQDCIYEVYDDYCEYTLMDWTVIDTAVLTGSDPRPVWPAPALSGQQQFGNQAESFLVNLVSDGETYTFTPDSQAEFSQFLPGSSWILAVNSFGAVVDAEPAD
ncbi:MAG: zinc ribbon domain-containing protein [Anaerolineales bacterium]|nr:zinc ribbon domain-containing protein [Anaerolineales bacterium]